MLFGEVLVCRKAGYLPRACEWLLVPDVFLSDFHCDNRSVGCV